MLEHVNKTQDITYLKREPQLNYSPCLRGVEGFNDGVVNYIKLIQQSESKTKHLVLQRLLKQVLNTTDLNIYLDASYQEGASHVGIGACVVGAGCYTLHGTRFGAAEINATKGELRAIEYGIKLLYTHLATQSMASITSVTLYSDVANVKQAKYNPVPWPFRANSQSTRLIAVDVAMAIEQLHELYPNLRYNLAYLSPRSQRYNFFYRAAHRLSRYISSY